MSKGSQTTIVRAIGISFLELMERYPTEMDVIDYFLNIKYPKGVRCPHCDSKKVVHRKETPRKFQCNSCNNSFSLFKSSIFKNSKVNLRKWLFVTHLVINAKKGISACQVHREIRGSYKTSWRMVHQIRKAMAQVTTKNAVKAIFEIDETYVQAGPKIKLKSKRGRGTFKTPIVGVYNREKDRIYATVALPNKIGQKLTGKQLLNILEKVATKDSTIMTDEFRGYNILNRRGYEHQRINHSKYQYSFNGINVNTVEGFWSIFKRGLVGSFHHVSGKYLQAYIDEFTFRFNNRKNKDIFYDLLERSLLE
ncbi:IS1595 family transposase [Leptospira kirschneri]|uniref:IS1595 family transposase n=1 Tax=Leptospira kirschneri TaxID=29507 RepID=UPI00046C650A|nr:IS1595 family transposase [Leptospira kirschneri]